MALDKTFPFLHPPPRIEETWRLWQRFLEDYSRFEDWLKSSERIAAEPNSSEVLYTHAKEELKKFEVNFLIVLSSRLNGQTAECLSSV